MIRVCRVSRKVGLLKRRVRSRVVRGEIKNCTPLWREAHFQVEMYKTPHAWTTFWSSDVEKLHAAVAKSTLWSQNAKKLRVREHFLKFRKRKMAKSTLWSQNVKNTSCSEHFLKFWCRKIARRSGQKRILKWKWTKHVSSGQFFEVLMLKNCMSLWREAHLSVKMYKIPVFCRPFLSSDVEQLVR